MKRLWTVFLAAAFVASVAGCSKEGDETQAEATEAAKPVELTKEDLPVTADFEEEADKQISTQNYKSELSKLEQEIASE